MRALLALVLSLTVAGAACAQPAKWPDRPLRFVVPLPPGSAADVMARVIGQRLSVKLGQPVIVENRAGASGILGSDIVAKAPPDGYTLGIATSTTHITAPILNPQMPYDPVKDFTHVALVGLSPYVLVVNPKVPANNVAELIALAKAKPKSLSYSSVGNASQAHLTGELFSTLAGVQLNHIPYKSSTHAVIDLNEGGGLVRRRAREIAQRVLALVGLEIHRVLRLVGDLQAEILGREGGRAFEIGGAEAHVGDVLKPDHVSAFRCFPSPRIPSRGSRCPSRTGLRAPPGIAGAGAPLSSSRLPRQN